MRARVSDCLGRERPSETARNPPSALIAPRTSSTRAGGTRTPSTCTLGLFWTGLVGCDPLPPAGLAAAAAATAAAFGMVGLWLPFT